MSRQSLASAEVDRVLSRLAAVGEGPRRAHRTRRMPKAPHSADALVVPCSHATCGARFASVVDAELHMQRLAVHMRCLHAHIEGLTACPLCHANIERGILTPERVVRTIQSPQIGAAMAVEAMRANGAYADDSHLQIEMRSGRQKGDMLDLAGRPLGPITKAGAE